MVNHCYVCKAYSYKEGGMQLSFHSVFLVNDHLISKMPYRCSVPNCKGNYATGPKVAVFSFPKDRKLRQKWLQVINYKNFEPTKSSRVCELHFSENDIERNVTFFNETGGYFEVPLKTRRLVAGAVPSKLLGSSSHLKGVDVSKPTSPRTKCLKMECRNMEMAIPESIQTSAAYKKLPKDQNAKRIWISVLGFDENHQFPKSVQICSRHFNETDFVEAPSGSRHLKRGTVPLPVHDLFDISPSTNRNLETRSLITREELLNNVNAHNTNYF